MIVILREFLWELMFLSYCTSTPTPCISINFWLTRPSTCAFSRFTFSCTSVRTGMTTGGGLAVMCRLMSAFTCWAFLDSASNWSFVRAFIAFCAFAIVSSMVVVTFDPVTLRSTSRVAAHGMTPCSDRN